MGGGTARKSWPIREKRVIRQKLEPMLHQNGRFVGRLPESKDLVAAAELWRQAYP